MRAINIFRKTIDPRRTCNNLFPNIIYSRPCVHLLVFCQAFNSLGDKYLPRSNVYFFLTLGFWLFHQRYVLI